MFKLDDAYTKAYLGIYKDYVNALYGAPKTKNNSIKNVIFNPPATVVFWTDNTKTVVKCEDGDEYDPEKGLAMAITKKALGNNGHYYNVFRKWLPKEDKHLMFDPNKSATLSFTLESNGIDGALFRITGIEKKED